MKTFKEYPSAREVYSGEPRAVRLELCDDHQFTTFKSDCSNPQHQEAPALIRYGVIGTEYGKLHGWHGGWRLFATPSGAYRAARALKSTDQPTNQESETAHV